MGRVVRSHDQLKPVADYEIAPHLYKWDDSGTSNEHSNSYKEWLESVPYKKGDVVYINTGEITPRKALILAIFWERSHYGELREKYRVTFETKKGFWSKLWEYTHPGFIQRGYKQAGLAPDVKE